MIPLFSGAKTSGFLSQNVPKLENELVKEYVRVAHFDFDQVRKLLEETTHLLNATQDWGMEILKLLLALRDIWDSKNWLIISLPKAPDLTFLY